MTDYPIERSVLAWYLEMRAEAVIEQREQWKREADEIRAVWQSPPESPSLPEEAAHVRQMVDGEERGVVRWDAKAREWVKAQSVESRRHARSGRVPRRAMTTADLDRFERLRPAGPGRWTARCPAHEDRTPSLSIRLTRDRWLFHCHAQRCDLSGILRGAGLFDVGLEVAR